MPTQTIAAVRKTSISQPTALRAIGNSCMWQSERWNRSVTKLVAETGSAAALQLALRLVRLRRHYDVVYTVGVRQAQMYGLACAIFGAGNKPHVATEILLDEPRPASRQWRMKRSLARFALHNVTRLIVFSSAEQHLYSRELELPPERICFVPFHTNILEPKFTSPGTYGFAAGRSLRDYQTLFAAVGGLDIRFVVVASRASIAGLEIPENVELHCDISRSRYLELLEGSHFVVVPLKADYRSTGQVVVLEAASLGKPIIASDVVGVRDYITHRENGLLVEPANPRALRNSIQLLQADDALCQKLAQAAMRRVEQRHTFECFADACLNVLAEACKTHQPAAMASPA